MALTDTYDLKVAVRDFRSQSKLTKNFHQWESGFYLDSFSFKRSGINRKLVSFGIF
jgi:hypothetical protein